MNELKEYILNRIKELRNNSENVFGEDSWTRIAIAEELEYILGIYCK